MARKPGKRRRDGDFEVVGNFATGDFTFVIDGVERIMPTKKTKKKVAEKPGKKPAKKTIKKVAKKVRKKAAKKK